MKCIRCLATVLILLAALALAACEDEEVEPAGLPGPGITVTPTTGLITTEDLGTATFNVVLNSQPADDVTIGLSSSDTLEGTVSPASLLFSALNWNVPQTVTVTGVDDPVADGSVIYTVITAPAVSTDLDYDAVDPADVTVTNVDNDPGIIVTPTTGLITTEFGGTDTFSVVLSTQPTADVLVGLTISNIFEGTVAPGGLTFTMTDWNFLQTVTVTGIDDFVLDGDVPYTILTDTAASVDPVYAGLAPLAVAVTNYDNTAFINPSFETGTLTGWITLDMVFPFLAIQVAPAGFPLPFFIPTNFATPTQGVWTLVHGFDGADIGPSFIRLMQDVGIPFGATTLLFDWRAAWQLTFGATLPRTFVVRIEPPGGGPPLQPDTPILTALPLAIVPDTGPQTALVNVSAFAGTVVRIVLEWSVPESSTGPGNFQVDNFLLL